MLDKNHIKKAFSRAASTYDESAELQKDVCRELAALAQGVLNGKAFVSQQPHQEFRILDVGAGTGQLASCISKIFRGASVIACDIAHSMLMKAREGRVLQAVCADFDGLPFADGLFDAVISNLTYQWADRGVRPLREVEPLQGERAFKEAGRVLRPGGYFIFSTLGPRTLHEMRECLKAADSMPFSTAGGIKISLEAAGFEAVAVEERPRLKVYKDIVHLLKTLKSVGALGRARRSGLANPSLLKEAGWIYKERFPAPDNAGIAATYDVIFASARRI